MPMMYVPGLYPLYSDFPQLPDDNSVEQTIMHNDSLNQSSTSTSTSVSTTEHAMESSVTSPSLQGQSMALRRPRYSRKVQSRSEPSGSGTTSKEF